LTTGIVLLWTMGLGLGPWYGAFLIRSHGMHTAELGRGLGLIFGFGGIAGISMGGYIASRWLSHDERTQMRLSASIVALLVPAYAAFLLLPGKHQALLTLVPLSVVLGLVLGPIFALMQRLVVDEMRATTLAVVMLLAHLIGMGIGPQVVGILSDLLMPSLGADSLRYAMLILSWVALWAAYHFWQVARTVKEDLLAIAHRNQSSAGLPGPATSVLKPATSE
jgi:predicted MFS family arabinose efflux permease